MKIIVLIVTALALLFGLFVWMKPAPQTVSAPPVVTATNPAGPVPAEPVAEPIAVAPAAQTFELVVKGKQLVSGPAVVSVVEGTQVTLRITSDHGDELHLHGYDLSLQLPAAQPAELSFLADRSGRFEYELHHAHIDLGVLEVQPR